MSDVFAIQVLLVVEDAELVPLPRIKNEVDDTAKYICHIHDVFRWNILFLAGHKHTVGDSANPKRFNEVCDLDYWFNGIALIVAGEHEAFQRRF